MWLSLHHQMDANDIVSLLYVSVKTVRRIVKLFLNTGDVEPSSRKNGPDRLISEFDELVLVQCVSEKPSMYLHELQNELFCATGTWVDCATVCRTLKRLGFSRKKIRYVALQQSEEQRITFMAEMVALNPQMLIWIDETGCERRNLIRKFGYSLRGAPPQDFALKVGGKRYSAITVMSVEGIMDVYLAEGSVDGDTFMDFVRRTLLPLLMPFDGINEGSVVILDNASIHRIQSVVETINSVGALVKFMPPYLPDFMPLEEVFAEVKGFLKANYVLFNCVHPRVIMSHAFTTVTPENCAAYMYVHHADYV